MMHSLKPSVAAVPPQQQHPSAWVGLRLQHNSNSCSFRRRRTTARTKTLSLSSGAAGWSGHTNTGKNNDSSNSDGSKAHTRSSSPGVDTQASSSRLQQQQQQQQQLDGPGNPLAATWHTRGSFGSAGHASSRSGSSNSTSRGGSSSAVRVAGPAAFLSLLLSFLDNVASSMVAASNKAAKQFQVSLSRASRFAAEFTRPESRLLLEGCHLGASLLFILLYVWSTYSPVVSGGPRWWLDLVLSVAFAADYTHRIMVSSSHPLLAILHPLAVIDLLSWAPSLLGVLLPACQVPWGLDLRWFRVFRALRLLRLSLLSGNLSTMKSNRGALVSGSMNVPLVWLFASVIAWLFTSASCVAVMEKWVWHDALYFVTSTLTTVGYGDVVVKSSLGRLVVLVMMLIGVVLIPVRASQLYSRLHERPLVAGHPPGDAPGCRGVYVVLSGRLSDVRGFNDFLQDFLVQVRGAPHGTPSRGRSSLQLVCLCNKPSAEFLALQELHESTLTLVEGSAFSERDLISRAALAGSAGVMVLADRFSTNASAEDTDVQFRVWAIKSAVKRVPLYVQVLRRESVAVISPFLDPAQDVISSIEGTRLRLLALSCFVPGASTLVANLLRSSGPNAGFAGGPRHAAGPTRRSSSVTSSPSASMDDILRSQTYGGTWGGTSGYPKTHQPVGLSSRDGTAGHAAATRSDEQSGIGSMSGRRWLREYADGAHCELFWCAAGPVLAGLRFSEVAGAMYQATGALPVGLVQERNQRLLLNPSSAVVRQGQQLVIIATTRAAAAAGAAGDGVERTQIMQSLRAAAMTAAINSGSSSMAGRLSQPQGSARVAAASSGSSSSSGSGVTVRVPGLLVEELAHYAPAAERLYADLVHQEQQQQQVQQQGLQQLSNHESRLAAMSGSNGQTQQTQRQQQPAAVSAGVASSVSPHVSRDLISQPGSSSGGIILDGEDYSDDELARLNPCLANWSGAYESDSMDETEICSDSEMREAARLQRQRQQLRQQQPQPVIVGRVPRAAANQAGSKGTTLMGKQHTAAAGTGGNGSSNSSSSWPDQGLAGYGNWPQQQQGTPKLSSPQQSSYHDRQQQWQQHRLFFGSQPLPPPRQLTGHMIIAGSATEFLPFAEQLHAIAPPESAPVTIVVLHPDPPPDDIYQDISNLGPTYYVRGKPSESAALAAAGAAYARSLVYLGPSERPTHLSSHAVSGVYGDPTVSPADYNSTSRTAVLADADALSSCYGVGEVLLPDILHTVVELGFTSSINFLQPGLLLHGRSAPHSQSSLDDGSRHNNTTGTGFMGKLKAVLSGRKGNQIRSSSRKRSRHSSGAGPQIPMDQQQLLHAAAGKIVGNGSSRAPSTSRDGLPAGQHQHPHHDQHPPQHHQQQQQHYSKQPRSSWRHRKEIEDAGREEGLTEWQLNSYYAAGRVMVPALLDTFTCQGFFKRRALLDLLTELAGDDGRPGGAMLRQVPVPDQLVGATYKELVEHFITANSPQHRYIPLGLIRRKSENRAWRLPYVATHPDPDAVLQMTDAVFVIRPQ